MVARIRPMAWDDLEAAVAVVRAGGWGEHRTQLSFYLRHPACSPLVAEVDGQVVGTGVGTRHGRVGWIGTIMVAQGWRRRGLGTDLARAAMDGLADRGCSSLALVATAMGRPLYEALGFCPDGSYAVMHGPGLAAVEGPVQARRLGPARVEGACALDRLVTGEDRGHLLRWFAPGGWALEDEQDPNGVRGFYVPTPWARAAAVALCPEDGVALLALARLLAGERPLTMVVPGQNQAALASLAAAGFQELSRQTRMVRGEPIAWQPEWVWGAFSLSLG